MSHRSSESPWKGFVRRRDGSYIIRRFHPRERANGQHVPGIGDMTVTGLLKWNVASPRIGILARTEVRGAAEEPLGSRPRRWIWSGQPGAVLPVLYSADGAAHDPGDSCIGTKAIVLCGRCGTRRRTMSTCGCAASHAPALTVNDIDFVMCTHLYVDHVGWNTKLENAAGVPTFPKARYLFSKTELYYWAGGERQDLAAADRRQRHPRSSRRSCDRVTSDDALDDTVSSPPTPGSPSITTRWRLDAAEGMARLWRTDRSPLQAKYPELAMRVDYDPKAGCGHASGSSLRRIAIRRRCAASRTSHRRRVVTSSAGTRASAAQVRHRLDAARGHSPGTSVRVADHGWPGHHGRDCAPCRRCARACAHHLSAPARRSGTAAVRRTWTAAD